MAVLENQPLGQTLLNQGVIEPRQLENALRTQQESSGKLLLGEILVEQKLCSPIQVCEALASSYGVPFVRVNPRLADPQVVGVLPKDYLESNQLVPLFLVEGVLTLAMAEPANVFLPEEVARITGHRVQIVAAPAEDIQATLDAYLPAEKIFVVEDFATDIAEAEFSLTAPLCGADAAESGALEPPVVRLVNACLCGALQERATDIHFEPGAGQLRVRYRIDGQMVERVSPPARMREALAARLRLLAGLELVARPLPREGSIAAKFRGSPISFRANFMPGRFGQIIVLHVVEQDQGPIRLEKLGFGYETLKRWRRLISRQSGLVLVTGPSGSGKRDTLYSSLRDRHGGQLNLCSIEDPIQQTLPGVNQFQVDEKNGFTFASALRSLLRQEPDVVMVSWMKDMEVTQLAAQAALSGRLILGALHAADAPSTVTRLLALGVEPYVVGATVAGVLAQRQVRRLCPACKEAYEASSAEKRHFEKFAGGCQTLYRARGCERCQGLGYRGRIAIHELLVCEDEIAERVSQRASLSELRSLSARSGMKTLRVDGLEKVKSGITTLDEVYRVTL